MTETKAVAQLETARPLARVLARELTIEEVAAVSGAKPQKSAKATGSCDPGGCSGDVEIDIIW